MTKELLTLEKLEQMDLPPIIIYAAPIMFALVLLEYLISHYQNRKVYDGKDFLAASTIGIVNVIINAAIKFGLFAVILVFYNLVPWYIPHTWWSYVLCFIAIDFCRYWAHKISHEQLFWWATHVTHHSSTMYNFSVSFRLSWVQSIKIIFFIPVALLGFDPVVFFICNQIAVLYQFWIHTEMINKLHPVFEYIFVTPSHHRVHHGTNPQYIDKNYGSSLIIWDRLFGTFEPERERPTYGITEPVNSYNPVYLVFHVYIDIYKALKQTKSFKEGWNLLFGSPGGIKLEAQTLENQVLEPVLVPVTINEEPNPLNVIPENKVA
jgi:sterol desaturase/sphingolipid hydroxylase (fatty acid hydroxylase superfamily)